MSTMKIAFLFAIAGHLLCGVCDCLLTYLPHGRFRFEDMKDNDRLSAAFRDMPLRNPLLPCYWAAWRCFSLPLVIWRW